MAQSIQKRNNVHIIGNGDQVIMFAHGFGCDQNMWRFITPAFQEEYKIVLFDYVGCGKSDWSAYNVEKYSTLNGYAFDILDICEELELNDVIFVGHSVSSMIGILAANHQPERFKSLLLIGPSACYIDDGDYKGGFSKADLTGLLDTMDNNYVGWANFLAPVIMKNADRPELTKELQDSFCATDPQIARKFAEATFFSDNRKDISKVSVPIFIMQCSDDAIAPDMVGEYLHKNIQGSKFVKMKATGHCPHMSHPEETIELITDFLESSKHAVAIEK